MLNKAKTIVEVVLFSCKWILIACYLKLIWTLIELTYLFCAGHAITTQHILHALEDVDVVMIANLVKMIITGSYNSFISKRHDYSQENISSGLLKVKIATSLVTIASIQILHSLFESAAWETINRQVLVFGVFCGGALILAVIDYLHKKSESFEDKTPGND